MTTNYDEFSVDEPGRTNYVLGHGTNDEQHIGWPDTHRPLRNYFAATQESLVLLRNTFIKQGMMRNIALIDGIWLTWIYSAMDVQRLNAECDALRYEVSDLYAQLAAMGEVFADIGSMIEANAVDTEKIGRTLQAMGEALLQSARRPLARVQASHVFDATATED